jgi:hypothetical protein
MITKEEFIQECIEKGNAPCRYIHKKAQDLYKRLEPVLKEEDKVLLKELTNGLPQEGEIAINLIVPVEWMLNKNFQEFLWIFEELSQGGKKDEVRECSQENK